MEFSKITAIIRPEVLEAVEKVLLKLNVPGVSISKGNGFSQHPNYFSPDPTVQHVRIELFIGEHRAEEIALAIMNASHTGGVGDGIVAVSPVETIYHIRKKEKCEYDACE